LMFASGGFHFERNVCQVSSFMSGKLAGACHFFRVERLEKQAIALPGLV